MAYISGAILAVCSCTVLPLFAGIYTRGAGSDPLRLFCIPVLPSMSWPLP
nr:hypothetical protein [uncultured Desulfobacter sp.]